MQRLNKTESKTKTCIFRVVFIHFASNHIIKKFETFQVFTIYFLIFVQFLFFFIIKSSEVHKVFVSGCGLISSTISLICTLLNEPEMVKIKKKHVHHDEIYNCLHVNMRSESHKSLKSPKRPSKLASASNLINLYSGK